MRFILLLALANLGACANFPDLDARVSAAIRDASYPKLEPLGPLIARVEILDTSDWVIPTFVVALNVRINNLLAKSTRIRGPVIDIATHNRMVRGVAVPASIR